MLRISDSHGIKLGICGKGRAGKDTAAEFLSTVTKMRYLAGTSLWYKDQVFSWYQENKPGMYTDAMSCWKDRHSDREQWAQIIGDINQDNPVEAYSRCLSEQDFLVGLRWRNEFIRVKKACIVDAWLWVENPRSKDDTCQVTADDCDFVVLNNLDLQTYLERLSGIACLLARKSH